jgi:hypothetical protein
MADHRESLPCRCILAALTGGLLVLACVVGFLAAIVRHATT